MSSETAAGQVPEEGGRAASGAGCTATAQSGRRGGRCRLGAGRPARRRGAGAGRALGRPDQGPTRGRPRRGASCSDRPCSVSSPCWPSPSAPPCPSSPFKLEMPGVWFFGEPSDRPGPARWGVYFALAAVYGGLFLLDAGLVGDDPPLRPAPGVSRQADGVGLRPVVAADAGDRPAVQPRRLLVRRPGRDGQPPHEPVPVRALRARATTPFTAPVDPLWGNAPAPYGPLFLQLDGFFARISFHNELATIVLLRLLALVGRGCSSRSACPGWPASTTGTAPSSSP